MNYHMAHTFPGDHLQTHTTRQIFGHQSCTVCTVVGMSTMPQLIRHMAIARTAHTF